MNVLICACVHVGICTYIHNNTYSILNSNTYTHEYLMQFNLLTKKEEKGDKTAAKGLGTTQGVWLKLP